MEFAKFRGFVMSNVWFSSIFKPFWTLEEVIFVNTDSHFRDLLASFLSTITLLRLEQSTTGLFICSVLWTREDWLSPPPHCSYCLFLLFVGFVWLVLSSRPLPFPSFLPTLGKTSFLNNPLVAWSILNKNMKTEVALHRKQNFLIKLQHNSYKVLFIKHFCWNSSPSLTLQLMWVASTRWQPRKVGYGKYNSIRSDLTWLFSDFTGNKWHRMLSKEWKEMGNSRVVRTYFYCSDS
jgi:hypothetical protein